MMFNIFKKKRCEHDRNYRSRKYLSVDGTPMIEFDCFDCGWKDHGHVYADAEKWEENLILVRNGVEIFKQRKCEDKRVPHLNKEESSQNDEEFSPCSEQELFRQILEDEKN